MAIELYCECSQVLKVWLVTSHWCIKILPLHIYGCEISLTWQKKFLVTSHWCIRNFSHVTYLGMWWHDVSWIMGLYPGRFGEEEEEREITCHPHESYTWSSLPMKYKTQKLDFELQKGSPETAFSTSFVTLLNGQCHLQQFQNLFSTSMETLFSDFTLSLPFKAQIAGLSLLVSFPFCF